VRELQVAGCEISAALRDGEKRPLQGAGHWCQVGAPAWRPKRGKPFESANGAPTKANGDPTMMLAQPSYEQAGGASR
jgi:hypothetical protein